MSRKSMIMFGMIAGSFAGGYGATLIGCHGISFGSLIGSTIGGLIGIWAAVKLTG